MSTIQGPMMVTPMDEHILMRLTKVIWVVGLLAFVYLTFPHLWGSVKFIFAWLSGLVSEATPTARSITDASEAFSNLFPILVLCTFGQLTLLSTPFLTTGSKALIAYYYERESDYAKTVSKRIELSKQIANASEQIQSLHSEIQQCRALLSHLGRDTKTLTDAVALSRKTLTAQIKQSSNLNDKGDF